MHEYKKILFFALIFLLILADQVSKYIIRLNGGFYICNKGVAFGLPMPIMLSLALASLILYLFINSNFEAPMTKKISNPDGRKFRFEIWNFIGYLDFEIWILLILAGGASNIIDRAYFGCVIDFIDLKFWPVFNVADIYITIGGIIIMLKAISKK